MLAGRRKTRMGLLDRFRKPAADTPAPNSAAPVKSSPAPPGSAGAGGAAPVSGAARLEKPAQAGIDDRALRVFTMGPSQEARWTRELLTGKGVEFEEIDASSEATLLSWIRQQTGSPEFPQVFLGRRLLGDFAMLRRLDLEGNLDRVLAGQSPIEAVQEEDTAPGSDFDAVRARLRRGDVLSLTTPDGETFDTWAEVFANPPQVYYRGEPRPIEMLDQIVREIVPLLADPRSDAEWSRGR
jgi:glutaredoxin 3